MEATGRKAVGGETGATTADPGPGIADMVQITVGPGRPIVDPDRQMAVAAEMAAVAGVMIFESHRPTILIRSTGSRTAVKTGRLIGNRIVERIAGRMPEEKCEGWIVPIR